MATSNDWPALERVEWDLRGRLAARLKCWSRLTGAEADELVAMFAEQVIASMGGVTTHEREDAKLLRCHAAGLTYNDTKAEGEAKHRLYEIAMRIETGYYSRASQQVPFEFPSLTPELAYILGMICFQCVPFAHALRLSGQQVNHRAEDEQAAALHWMLVHYFRHGEDGWRKAAGEDMERMCAAATVAKGGTQ